MCEHPPKDVHTLTQSSLFGDEVIQYCARCNEILGTWEGEGPLSDDPSPSPSENRGGTQVPKITYI